jgi:hypothetical protein
VTPLIERRANEIGTVIETALDNSPCTPQILGETLRFVSADRSLTTSARVSDIRAQAL